MIDLAQRVNRRWRGGARRAALVVGLVESSTFRSRDSALGGYKSVGVPIRRTLVSDGFFRFDLAQVFPR
jgi:hypothetical protein